MAMATAMDSLKLLKAAANEHVNLLV